MLEKERESSVLRPAASSQHVKPRAGEVEKPRSIQQKVGAAVRLSQEQPSDEDQKAEFMYKRGDARAAVQEKTERNGTREVLPRTATTLVVLKASAYHTHRGEVPRDRDRAAFKQTTASEGWQDFRTFVFDAV